MTEPRIGDTVHYWRRTSTDPGTCIAAIVTGHGDRDGQLALALIRPEEPALHHREVVNYDTDGAILTADGDTYASFGGFTPGTWHNLH